MTTVYWNDVNPADYHVGSKHTVGEQTLIVADQYNELGVVLTETGELPVLGPKDVEGWSSRTAWSLPSADPGATE